MQVTITNRQADSTFREGIVGLLQSENLPTNDLPPLLEQFKVAFYEEELVAAGGMERYGNVALLRSLAVKREFRKMGVAKMLISCLEEEASTIGIDSWYLLTESASGYFARQGFEIISRDEVPLTLKSSSQFSYVCPVSATVMKKVINK